MKAGFLYLNKAENKIEIQRQEYNKERPHVLLETISPLAHMLAMIKGVTLIKSTLKLA
jgi:hypothetical protein